MKKYQIIFNGLAGIVITSILYITSLYNYLLFHVVVELFTIVVGVIIFILAWNARQHFQRGFILLLGIAYLFIALMDLTHTLSYIGMPFLQEPPYSANQLWIIARYTESISLLVAFTFFIKKRLKSTVLAFVVFGSVFILAIFSVFVWKNFPVCFIAGYGLTLFKIVSEYIISGLLALSLLFLYINHKFFDKSVYQYLFLSIVFTILSELAFAFYISNYGISNFVGHCFKLISFYLVYKAVIEKGIKQPYLLLFRELDQSHKILSSKVEELQHALSEIHTLKGLLPMCSKCKKIRDDDGYWSVLENYLQTHSNARVSHGLCPDCAKELYPDFYDNEKEIKDENKKEKK